jgi:hypothetical protein
MAIENFYPKIVAPDTRLYRLNFFLLNSQEPQRSQTKTDAA